MNIEILYEDSDIIAIHKPAGIPSQSTPDPRRPHILGLLQKQRPDQIFFLHHRLDKDTSGVMVLGLSPRANPGLTDLFREHRIQKTYHCLCLRSEKSFTPEGGIWPLRIQNHLAPVKSGSKLMRMVVVKKGGWKAETEVKLSQSLAQFDLFEARPLTGRTHQIRVHMAGLFRPIAGDSLYGGKSSEVPRLMLHASSLQLRHPCTGHELLIKAPWPPDFSTLASRKRIE